MTLQDILENLGYEPRSYSGRGMFGEYRVGVTTDAPLELMYELGKAVAELEGADENDVPVRLTNVRTDSMGHSTIVYWPHIAWEEDSEN